MEQWESVQTLQIFCMGQWTDFHLLAFWNNFQCRMFLAWLEDGEGGVHTNDLVSELGWGRKISNRSWSPVKQIDFMLTSSLVPKFLLMPVKSATAHQPAHIHWATITCLALSGKIWEMKPRVRGHVKPVTLSDISCIHLFTITIYWAPTMHQAHI